MLAGAVLLWPTSTAMDSRASGAAGYSTESGRHPGTTLTDAANPDPGTGFYYVIRASNACGTGSFGAASSGIPRGTGACP